MTSPPRISVPVPIAYSVDTSTNESTEEQPNQSSTPAIHTVHYPRQSTDNGGDMEPPYEMQDDEQLEEPGELPSYDNVRAEDIAHGRVKRWNGWKEKRDRETRDERAAKRMSASGDRVKTSWDLDGAGSSRPPPLRTASEIQHKKVQNEVERKLIGEMNAKPKGLIVTNPDEDQTQAGSRVGSNSSAISTPINSELLTLSGTSIFSLGERFGTSLEEEPLCSVPLPIKIAPPTSHGNKPHMFRFLLVGTEDGLYCLDLRPSLANTNPTARKSDNPAEVKLNHIWKNTGVYHMDIMFDNDYEGEFCIGKLLALVKPPPSNGVESPLELRIWPLESFLSLVKWRCFNSEQEPIDMSKLVPERISHEVPSKRLSRAFLKNIIGSPTDLPEHSIPILNRTDTTDSFQIIDLPAKKPSEQENIREKSLSLEVPLASLKIDTTAPTELDSSPSSGVSPISGSNDHATILQEWLTIYKTVPIPRLTNPTDLSIKLLPLPSHDNQVISDYDDDSTLNLEEKRWFVLAIFTSHSLSLYWNDPTENKWTPLRDLYTPSPPTCISLVRCVKNERPKSMGGNISPIFQDISVFIQTKEKAVLVALVDLTVMEVDIDIPQTTDAKASEDVRRGTRETARQSISRAVNFVQAFVAESRATLPAGMKSSQPIITGKKTKDRSSSIASVVSLKDTGGVWTDCSELWVPTPSNYMRKLYFITKGKTTVVVFSPFDLVGLDPTHACFRVAHRFSWQTPLVKLTISLRDKIGSGYEVVLYGLTKTGVMVTESVILSSVVEELYNNPSKIGTSKQPVLFHKETTRRRRSLEQSAASRVSEIELDLSLEASFDFGNKVGYLCPGHSWWRRARNEHAGRGCEVGEETSNTDGALPMGVFFWTTGLSDYPIKYIGL